MTKDQQISLLKRDVRAWNALREEVPIDFEADDIYTEGFIGSDLTCADLRGVELSNANLEFADLTAAKLRGAKLSDASLTFSFLGDADLREADLLRADLSHADAEKADFRGADLRAANLNMAHLTRAKLREAKLGSTDLSSADLSSADLRHADLRGADLFEANLSHADLAGANVTRAIFGATLLAAIDLSQVIGLSTTKHSAPSTIGIDTIVASKGNIERGFLRGSGVPEPFIANMRALVGAMEPIQFYSCFISYSGNHAFAERLYSDLLTEGVRCWKCACPLGCDTNS